MKIMEINKYSFNKMPIEKQVDFFNCELSKGKTISQICNDINISYNTVRDRFVRHNYSFNKYSKKYENPNQFFQYDEKVIEKVLEKVVTKVFNPNDLDEKLKKDDELICNVEGNVINRSFRIYDSTLKDFISFCEKSNYNQYDILSQFITDGIERYNKII